MEGDATLTNPFTVALAVSYFSLLPRFALAISSLPSNNLELAQSTNSHRNRASLGYRLRAIGVLFLGGGLGGVRNTNSFQK
ncbi:hypothetical protein B0H63DRAFT_178195 [Podospora didyma]|uniref:Uncharacterized protein n=1 Tax=Podospora didyma TaxID=330526 RepID=A0AAE0NP12_9PEZI|nr:hypothetical protein B0H63DRAFT_178195 [Podospora didyma]